MIPRRSASLDSRVNEKELKTNCAIKIYVFCLPSELLFAFNNKLFQPTIIFTPIWNEFLIKNIANPERQTFII